MYPAQWGSLLVGKVHKSSARVIGCEPCLGEISWRRWRNEPRTNSSVLNFPRTDKSHAISRCRSFQVSMPRFQMPEYRHRRPENWKTISIDIRKPAWKRRIFSWNHDDLVRIDKASTVSKKADGKLRPGVREGPQCVLFRILSLEILKKASSSSSSSSSSYFSSSYSSSSSSTWLLIVSSGHLGLVFRTVNLDLFDAFIFWRIKKTWVLLLCNGYEWSSSCTASVIVHSAEISASRVPQISD